MCHFLFFKQNTAYEMRISDWSSDVCSSDVVVRGGGVGGDLLAGVGHARRVGQGQFALGDHRLGGGDLDLPGRGEAVVVQRRLLEILGLLGAWLVGGGLFGRLRSEEHTSELQSLMRISYAVFCL